MFVNLIGLGVTCKSVVCVIDTVSLLYIDTVLFYYFCRVNQFPYADRDSAKVKGVPVVRSEQESQVSTLPVAHGRYSAMGTRPASDTGNCNILRHSQPYDAINHPESKRSSLNMPPDVSPRTSSSNT